MALDEQVAGAEKAGALAAELVAEPARASLRDPRAAEPQAEPVRRVGRRRAAGPSRGAAAANDDAPSIGGLIYALQQRPSRRPFEFAAMGTAVWVLLGVVLGVALLAPQFTPGRGLFEVLVSPAMVTAVAAILIPIALLWFLALLVWRMQELKLVSSAMTEVAVRLAEPDRLAEQSVASLGQSVRRQVAAMNDAISRALGRAGELEALVHNEVAALERSYAENELRIRSLIDEIASERDALANNGERVTETIRGIGDQISRNIFAAGDQAARSLAQASASVSDQISDKGNTLLISLTQMHQRIGNEVPVLLEKLGGEQTRLTRIIEGAAKNLTALETTLAQRTGTLEAALGDRTEHLATVLRDYSGTVEETLSNYTQEFENRARALDASVGDKLARLDQSISETGRLVEEAVASRADALDAALVERTKAIDVAFAERLRTLDDSIARGTAVLDQAISDRAHALRYAMERHAESLSEALRSQTGDLDERLVASIEAVRRSSEVITSQSMHAIGGLATQSKVLKEVSEGLLGQIHHLTDRFEMQSSSVLRAASMLEATQTSAGSSLHARQAELDRLRHETEANAERTIADLKRRFTSVSREVSDQIAGLNRQVNATTSQVHERTQAAKGELENTRVLITQASQMPAHARESVEGVRRTLQEQLKALEALSSFSRDQASLRDVTPPEGAGPPQQRRATTTEPATRPVAVEPSPQQMALNRLRRRPDDRPPAQQSNQSAAPGPATVAGDIAGVLRETTWSLGDLLARASREDEEGGGMPPAAAADARPIDLANIAEAIDAQTAANAWSRYRSGERGVFSRQLYSRQGQMTFDEITRRYQADNGFRAMSDRYLADFERLLREAEAKDQSGRLVQNHLVAETGRVYLLLAHASGRIG